MVVYQLITSKVLLCSDLGAPEPNLEAVFNQQKLLTANMGEHTVELQDLVYMSPGGSVKILSNTP